jgi:hypothetical protein
MPTTILPFNEKPACVKCGGTQIATHFHEERELLDKYYEFLTRRCLCGFTWHEHVKGN